MAVNHKTVGLEVELANEDRGNGMAETKQEEELTPSVEEELEIDNLWDEAVSETEALRKQLEQPDVVAEADMEEPEAVAEFESEGAGVEAEAEPETFEDRWIEMEDVPLEAPVAAAAEPEMIVEEETSEMEQEVEPAPQPVMTEWPKPAPKEKAPTRSERSGPNMLLWFLGAALVGAVLGAVATALILSGINGGLSYVTTTSGIQLLQEQARLSGDLTELTADLVAVENELANLSGLPAEMATLSGNVTAVRRDLDATITGLQELGVALNDVNQDLSTLDGQVVSLGSSLTELAAEAEALQEQATALETTVGKLGTSVEQIDEQVTVLNESKAKFDGFIEGLRALVSE